MIKILLIVPCGKGTIAKISYNLYLQFSSIANISLQVVNMNYEDDDTFIFKNAYKLKKNNKFKILFYINRIKQLHKIKKIFQPNVSISTLNVCTTANIVSGGDEKKVAIFHAPMIQAKRRGMFHYLINEFSYHFIYSKVDKYIAISEEIKKDLIKNIKHSNENNTRVVYNVHNIEEILKKSKEPLEDKYIKIFGKKVILCVGNIDENKSQDRIVRAISLLNSIEDINVVFIGNGNVSFIQKLKDLASLLNIDDHFFFIGYQSNPYKYMRASNMVILASKSEGLPGVLIESLILNIPIITTNSSIGVWEILSCMKNYDKDLSSLYIANKGIITSNTAQNKDNIKLINSDDINLSTAISLLLNNLSLYDKLISNKFDFCSSLRKFDYKKYI